MQRRDISAALFASAAGSLLAAQRVEAQTCTAPCYVQTAAELAAGVTPTNRQYIPYDMRRYGADSTGATDSHAIFNTIIAMAASQGIRQIWAPGKYMITAPILIDNVPNQGISIYIDELIAGTTGSWASAPANWKSGVAMIKIGTASAGSMINVNLWIGSMRGNSKHADGIHIGDGSYGCALSQFWVGDVQQLNIFGKGNSSSLWPTSSNRFLGDSITNCNMGFYFVGATNPIEGCIVDFDFVWGNAYGGIYAGQGCHFGDFRSQLDFNGQQLTEFKVSTTASFSVGDTITGHTSGKTAEVIAIYPYQGSNFLLGIEFAKTYGGISQFTNGETVTNTGAGTAVLTSTRSTNQGGSAFYFDIILANNAESYNRHRISAPYLGGIVGNWLYSCTIQQGNSANPLVAQMAGLGLAAGGGVISLYDEVNDGSAVMQITGTLLAPQARDLYLGNAYRLYSTETQVSLPNGTPTTVFSSITDPGIPGGATVGAQWLFVGMSTATVGLRAMGLVSLTGTSLAYDAIIGSNVTMSVSGTNLVATQGTGGAQNIRATLTRLR